MNNYFFSFLKTDDHVIIFGPATDVLKHYVGFLWTLVDLLASLCRFVSGTSNVVSSANLNNNVNYRQSF